MHGVQWEVWQGPKQQEQEDPAVASRAGRPRGSLEKGSAKASLATDSSLHFRGPTAEPNVSCCPVGQHVPLALKPLPARLTGSRTPAPTCGCAPAAPAAARRRGACSGSVQETGAGRECMHNGVPLAYTGWRQQKRERAKHSRLCSHCLPRRLLLLSHSGKGL